MTKPEQRDYQDKALRKIEHFRGRALLAYEMRMGKTFIALQWLKNNPKIGPAVVVCPEIGKLHWEEKALRYFGIRSVILNGTTPPERKFIHKNRLYILNWEILQYWVEFLQRAKVIAPILDEVHYIKESKTQCYKATKKLVKPLPYIIGLSGTGGLKSRPIEMFNILNLIRPDKFPSIVKYRWRYCKPKYKPWGWDYKGADHLDELYENLNAWCMVRMLRKDAMGDLPKNRRIVPISISNKSEYYEAENNFIVWLRKRSLTRAHKAKKAERLVQMGYLRRLAASLKMPGTLKWIDRWLDKKDGKLAIFAIHRKIIQQLRDRYKGICVVVDGNVRGKKRHLAVKTFQIDKKCRIFIGQSQAAGTVIELSKAKAAIGIELDWTPGGVTQWEDRIFDPNSDKPMRIYYLVAKDTIEHHLCEILQSKQNIISEILDGSKKKNQLNVFDLLEKALLKGR